MISQKRPKRKSSGAKYKYIIKKLKNKGNLPTLTKIAKTKTKTIRVKAGKTKTRLLQVNTANVYDPKTKKYQKVKIETIVDSPANRHYVRRNILTKGAIIKTELGNAKVTSRPGQEPVVNAVLIEK